MNIALGIDAGGTYTDAVLINQQDGVVLAASKALTTHHQLSLGIEEAMRAVFSQAATLRPEDVELVGLSTTLATNAIVEGEGAPVCLLLIGYDTAFVRDQGFEQDFVTRHVVYIAGGHDGLGNEAAPLDEAAAREAILAYRDEVAAFAVSGYFSVRNPEHELRVRALVETLTGREGCDPLPVTCGHELTTRLNAVRRATTVALNARLIPLLRDLIMTMQGALDRAGIDALLMIVKGDGSLVRAAWALRRPIETILSGPAASVVGAWHLAGRRDTWVVDVGGTTTDIAVLRDGRPRLNPRGAQIGRWRTMVEAVDIYTMGLGGDSQVHLNGGGSWTHIPHLMAPDGEPSVDKVPSLHNIAVGPRRVVPLCLLARMFPQILEALRAQVARAKRDPLLDGQFVVLQRQAEVLSESDQGLVEQLADGPQSLYALVESARYGHWLLQQIVSLEARQVLQRAAFTPTDALHVLGRFAPWETEAAHLGAELLAAQLHLAPEVFCERVAAEVSSRVSTALVSKALSNGGGPPDWAREPSAAALLTQALGGGDGADLGCQLTLKHPVVAVGAPVEAYMPRATKPLHTELVIPPYADVANATGAVVGGVVQRVRVLIRPIAFGAAFRLHLPDAVRDFDSVEEAVVYAQGVVPDHARALAQQAGADHVEVQMTRVDQQMTAEVGEGQEVYLETALTFTAIGRPSLARHTTPIGEACD
jgi:N-methylhydantoinase A/oxoprolinase/acetone carboxylase beta subunit